MLGFFMWLNFSRYGAPEMFIYYPVILLGVATILLFNPFRILYYRSRLWLVYSMVRCKSPSTKIPTNYEQWRLVCAGFYPVEWRDFYMGDMFCSLTYAMGVSCAYSRTTVSD